MGVAPIQFMVLTIWGLPCRFVVSPLHPFQHASRQVWTLHLGSGGNEEGLAYVQPMKDGQAGESLWVVDSMKTHLFRNAKGDEYIRIPELGMMSIADLCLKFRAFTVTCAPEYAGGACLDINCSMFEYPLGGAHVWWHVKSIWNELKLKLYPGARG